MSEADKPFTGKPWNYGDRGDIALNDKVGLARYHKLVDFQRYERAMRLKVHWSNNSKAPLAVLHLRAQSKVIQALEAKYPDFRKAYNDRYVKDGS